MGLLVFHGFFMIVQMLCARWAYQDNRTYLKWWCSIFAIYEAAMMTICVIKLI